MACGQTFTAYATGLVDPTMSGRPGTTSDVEGVKIILASNDSACASGGIFTIDGGLTAL